jgi:hypothetical protein
MADRDRRSRSYATLGLRPPASGASRHERRLFVRDLNARAAFVGAALLLIALIAHATTWLVLVCGLAVIIPLLDAAWLTATLRRDRPPGS